MKVTYIENIPLDGGGELLHPMVIFQESRKRVIQQLHDYIAAQPGKCMACKETIYENTMVTDGEAHAVTYNHVSISDDSSVVVNYTDYITGETYTEDIEYLSMDEIHDFIRLI